MSNILRRVPVKRVIDNAILLLCYQPAMTGTQINVFDYYIKALEYNPDVKLVFVDFRDNNPIEHYSKIYEERFYLDDLDWKSGIITMNIQDLITTGFDNVVILDFGTIPPCKQLLRANHVTVVSELHTDSPNYMLDKDNYKSLTYYGEMPFVYKDHQYRMKMSMDRWKPFDNPDERIFITSRADEDVIQSKLELLPDKPVLKRLERAHIPDFFSKWDELLYVRTENWFDPHPRCFIEAKFYGKKIHYFNDEEVKDGGWYRWLDINERGLEDRQLTKEDVIIQQLI